MFYNAKNHTLRTNDMEIDYVSFGRGKKNLIIIPGLSLRGVKGTAMPLAYMYRIFAREYKVYVVDKRNNLPSNYTIDELAKDVASFMNELGISDASVFGVSQGGMIAQHLAINYPNLVNKLVLAVTASRTNETITKVINEWIQMVENKNYDKMTTHMLQHLYSDDYLKKYNWLLPIATKVNKLNDIERFITLAKACLTCGAFERLQDIKCPVLVLGGSKDKIVTGDASIEMAEKLDCEIHMYDELGHAAYEEAPDFNERIYRFLSK
ncbi:MAG: alpha/beta hydrolase [Erysipelotrichales bacterium]|nr:alpha/beta hydrolase [Erysipelotrichales bacterium]